MAKQLTFAQFEERMRRADKRLVKSLHKQLTILALQSARQAKKNATTYPRVRTGRLRSSITGFVDAKSGNPRMFLRAGGDTRGAPVRYARFVEFGTEYMDERLFMGRAIKKTIQEAPKELRDVLRISLSKDPIK